MRTKCAVGFCDFQPDIDHGDFCCPHWDEFLDSPEGRRVEDAEHEALGNDDFAGRVRRTMEAAFVYRLERERLNSTEAKP